MNTNGAQPDDLDESALRQVGQFLEQWQPPAVDPAKKALLIAQIRQPAAVKTFTRPPLRMTARWAWLIARAQMRLVNPVTWVGSALVLALGTIVTLISAAVSGSPNLAALPLLLVAPIVCAAGVAFLYGNDVDPPLELQRSMPVSPRMILLARLAVLYGFNLTLTALCSAALALASADISLAPLIWAWLAPMTFLSALAFLMSVLFFDTTISILICMLAWSALVYRHLGDPYLMPFTGSLPDLLHADMRLMLVAAAALMIIFGLWYSEKRWE